MVETSEETYFIAAAVVGVSLIGIAVFLGKTFVTSNLFNKGVTLYKEKNYASAEEVFREVSSRQRTNDMVRLLLGNALMEQGKIDEAKSAFQELIERSPKNIDAYLRLGSVLIKQDKISEAIATFEKAKNLYKKRQESEKKDIERLIAQLATLKSES
jgi:tetratricopeptide (TPR) repeat protein